MARVAAEPVPFLEFDERVGKHLFDAGTLDLAGGEGVALDDGRCLAQHGRDPPRRQLPAVERAEIGELAAADRRNALPEIILPAGGELEVGRRLVAVLVE